MTGNYNEAELKAFLFSCHILANFDYKTMPLREAPAPSFFEENEHARTKFQQQRLNLEQFRLSCLSSVKFACDDEPPESPLPLHNFDQW